MNMKVDEDEDKKAEPLYRKTPRDTAALKEIVKQMEKPALYCRQKLNTDLGITSRTSASSHLSEDSAIESLAEMKQAIVAETHRTLDGRAACDPGESRGFLGTDAPSLWPTSNPVTQGAATSQERPTASTARGLLEADAASLQPIPRPPAGSTAPGRHRPTEPTPRLTDGRMAIRNMQAEESSVLQSPAEADAVEVQRENEAHMMAREMLTEVERLEHMLRDLLLQQVLSIAFILRKEGIVTIPAIAWDGSLGPEEQRIINRVGFLINAYSVQTWYWEVSPPSLSVSCFLQTWYWGLSVRLALCIPLCVSLPLSFKALLLAVCRHR